MTKAQLQKENERLHQRLVEAESEVAAAITQAAALRAELAIIKGRFRALNENAVALTEALNAPNPKPA